jgi:hypothetical protein
VPIDLQKKVKKADFIWRFAPLFLEKSPVPKGTYLLSVSARHLTAPKLEVTKRLRAFARLRAQALTDLQAWFAHQGNRPGMLTVR